MYNDANNNVRTIHLKYCTKLNNTIFYAVFMLNGAILLLASVCDQMSHFFLVFSIRYLWTFWRRDSKMAQL